MTAANASLSEAHALLKADRERMASLEQLLEQREHELEEHTASLCSSRRSATRRRRARLRQRLARRGACALEG